jgi:hypothetical protein
MQLRAAIDSVPNELRSRAPGEGCWSVDGVVEHLAMVEGRIAGVLRTRLDDARAAGVAQETDDTPLLPFPLLERILDRSATIKAGAASQPTGQLTGEAGWETLQGTRRQIEEVLADADGIASREIVHPHPALGPIDLYTWFAFVGAHERRHAAQIREIGASLTAAD